MTKLAISLALFAALILPSVFPVLSYANSCDIEAFYGVNMNFNVQDAFECYSKNQSEPRNLVLLSLMFLNGDGTKSDPKKAMELLKKSIELSKKKNLDQEVLEKKIQQKIDSASHIVLSKISYCRTIAISAEGVKWCARNYFDYTRYLEDESLKVVAQNMGDLAKSKLEALKKEFHTFIDAEADFGMKSCSRGISDAEGTAEDKFYKDKANRILRFNHDVSLVVDRRFPKSVTAQVFQQSDTALNKMYTIVKTMGDAKRQEQLKRVENFWIHYRDAWIDFVAALLAGSSGSEDRQLAMRNWLTVQQIYTLKQNICK